MSIGQRIKEVRKILKIKTQQTLADKLGTTRDRIANIELDRISIDDMFISYFCKEFGVSENWLRTGNGEKFVKNNILSFNKFVKEKNLTPLETKIIKELISLNEEEQKKVLEYFKFLIYSRNNEITVTQEEQPPRDLLEEERKEISKFIEEKKAIEQQKLLDKEYNDPSTKKDKLHA